MADASEQPVRRRKRNMLKLFYGGDTAPKDQSGDPLDIDSSAFNSDTYLNTIYNRLALPELVAKERSLGQQIKTLDSDMQTLVYENYNKFISATDTIRKMKSKVDEMEGEMENLSKNMDTINTLNDSVTDALSSKRARIRKLTESHLLLKKLQFLFELPARLHKCVEMKAYAEAVKYYSRAANVLEQYKDLDSFKGIYDDCKNIMADITVIINEKIDEEGATKDQIISNARLLLLLNHDPAELAERVFKFSTAEFERNLEMQKQVFESAMTEPDTCIESDVAEVLDSKFEAPKEGEKTETPTSTTSDEREAKDPDPGTDKPSIELDGGDTLEEATETDKQSPAEEQNEEDVGKQVDTARENKEDPLDKHPLMKFIDFGVVTVLEGILDWVLLFLEAFVDPGQRRGGQDPSRRAKDVANVSMRKLSDYISELIGDQYITMCVKKFIGEMKRPTDTPTSLFVKGILKFSEGFATLDWRVKDAKLGDADREATVTIVKSLCRTKAEQLQTTFKIQLKEIDSKISSSTVEECGEILQDLSTWIQQECFNTLQSLQPFVGDELVQKNKFFGQEFQDRSIRRGIVQGFLTMMISHSASHADLRRNSADGAMPIVLAGLCQQLKNGLIKKLVVFAVKLFPGREVDPDENPDDIDDASEMQIAQRRHEAAEAAQQLLQSFIMCKGNAVADTYCLELSNSFWVEAPEPTKVSPHVATTLQSLAEARSIVNLICDKPKKIRKSSSFQHYVASKNKGINSAFSQMFSERVEIFSTPEFDLNCNTLLLIKIILKAILETTRIKSFSKYGLQQMEVDIHFLGTKLWAYVDEDNEGAIGTMLSQITQSTSYRCYEPDSIKSSVIALICGDLEEEDDDEDDEEEVA